MPERYFSNQIDIKIGGTDVANLTNSSSDLVITQAVQDKDIIFKGNDGGSAITALTIDMSDAGIVNIKSSPRATGTETNDMAYQLESNTGAAEANQIDFWFLSNGFKLDGSGSYGNGASDSYFYMAFADHPFVSSKGVPCTAR